MNKIAWNSFEERLYIRSSDTSAIERYKRSSLVSGILFSLLFAGAWFVLRTEGKLLSGSWILNLILALYAVMTCLTVLNFGRVLRTYRSLLVKIEQRLAERTKDCEWEKKQETACRAVEISDKRNMILLTVFYGGILAALTLQVLPPVCLLLSTVFFLLLSAFLKCRFAGYVIQYKKCCFEEGSLLRQLTWPDGETKS